MAKQWKDHVILITGASSGIGEATAHAAAREGARTILVARREEELRRVARSIQSETGELPLIFAADLTDPRHREELIRFVEKREGAINYLINNAGISTHGPFEKTDPEVLRKTMEINFFSMAELTRLSLPLLRKGKGERGILFVSTPSGLHGIPERFAYSASKAAGHMLMESLRFEHRKDGIFTTIFCPGYTRTALRTSGLAADGSTLHEEQARGAKSPEEVARLLLRSLKKRKRTAFTDLNGRVVYFLRTLAPALLEWLIRRKLG